jgi:hypothetical protein
MLAVVIVAMLGTGAVAVLTHDEGKTNASGQPTPGATSTPGGGSTTGPGGVTPTEPGATENPSVTPTETAPGGGDGTVSPTGGGSTPNNGSGGSTPAATPSASGGDGSGGDGSGGDGTGGDGSGGDGEGPAPQMPNTGGNPLAALAALTATAGALAVRRVAR